MDPECEDKEWEDDARTLDGLLIYMFGTGVYPALWDDGGRTLRAVHKMLPWLPFLSVSQLFDHVPALEDWLEHHIRQVTIARKMRQGSFSLELLLVLLLVARGDLRHGCGTRAYLFGNGTEDSRSLRLWEEGQAIFDEFRRRPNFGCLEMKLPRWLRVRPAWWLV